MSSVLIQGRIGRVKPENINNKGIFQKIAVTMAVTIVFLIAGFFFGLLTGRVVVAISCLITAFGIIGLARLLCWLDPRFVGHM